MALPSLAFGIGLSGKPIDRAALNLQREAGAQKAKAREAEDKRKQLEPYQKMIMDIGTKSYLPFQRKIIQEKQASLWKYIADNAENVDYSQLGGMMTDLSQSAAMYQNDYKNVSKAQLDPKNSYQAPAFKILTELDNPEDINSALKNYAGMDNFGVNADNTVNFTPSPFTTVTDYSANFIKATGKSLFENLAAGTEEAIYGGKVVTNPLKPEVYETVVQGIYKDPIQFRSSRNEYEAILRQQNQVPDFTTQKGVDQFNQGLDQYIRETSKQTLDNYTKDTLLKEGKASNFNFNMGGDGDAAGVTNPIDTEVLVKVNGVDMGANSTASYATGDLGISIPADSETYSTSGKKLNKIPKGAKYNKTGVHNVLAEDFTIKNGVTLIDDNGKSVTFKTGDVFEKGTIIPDKLMNIAVQNGVKVDSKALAFFVDSGNNIGYTDITSIVQSQYSKAAANKQPAIVGIYDAQIQARDNIKQLQNNAKPKTTTPRKQTTPAPSGGKKQIKGF